MADKFNATNHYIWPPYNERPAVVNIKKKPIYLKQPIYQAFLCAFSHWVLTIFWGNHYMKKWSNLQKANNWLTHAHTALSMATHSVIYLMTALGEHTDLPNFQCILMNADSVSWSLVWHPLFSLGNLLIFPLYHILQYCQIISLLTNSVTSHLRHLRRTMSFFLAS